MPFKFIRKFLQNTVYIKFSSEKVHLRYVEKKQTIDDELLLAAKRDHEKRPYSHIEEIYQDDRDMSDIVYWIFRILLFPILFPLFLALGIIIDYFSYAFSSVVCFLILHCSLQ